MPPINKDMTAVAVSEGIPVFPDKQKVFVSRP
jgi:hypothetical protein